MDPVTHFLTGAAISRSGLNRKTALATLTLVLAAEAPDIDVFMRIFGPVSGFRHHRGITHTFLGVPFMAAAVLGVVYVINLWMVRRRETKERERAEAEAARQAADPARYRADDHVPIVVEPLPIRWKLLYGYAVLGLLSHILLDFTNSYGIRPFSPFYPHWYAWNIVSIIEFSITIPLLLALVGPWFFGLVGGELGAKRQRFPGRKSAIAALILIALVWWVRDYNHRRAMTLLQAELYGGKEGAKFFAGPYGLNPFRWLGVVETDDAFHTVIVDTLHDEVDPQKDEVTRYKPEETAFSLAAKVSPMGRVYLDWAKFPHTETELISDTEGGGAIVYIHDLRFVYPGERQDFLGVRIELDRDHHVVHQSMGSRGPD